MIYYVEDDDNIRELVVYTLSRMDLPTRGFRDGAAFDAAMALEKPDLILLDIMLPNEDGMSILRRLRGDGDCSEIPVIMVTAKGTEYDKVTGLEDGADDYITKPFGMAELAARVRARLRRANKAARQEAHVHEAGALKLDNIAHTVTVEGERVVLTLKEYEMLHFLMENRGAVYSREALLEHIWDYGYTGGTRTVDVHIQTLRSKLGSCGALIETVRGVGYRFGGR